MGVVKTRLDNQVSDPERWVAKLYGPFPSLALSLLSTLPIGPGDLNIHDKSSPRRTLLSAVLPYPTELNSQFNSRSSPCVLCITPPSSDPPPTHLCAPHGLLLLP